MNINQRTCNQIGILIVTIISTVAPGFSYASEFPEVGSGIIEEAITDEEYFEGAGEAYFKIDDVSERHYGSEEPERLPVGNVIISGIESYDDQNITPENVQPVLEVQDLIPWHLELMHTSHQSFFSLKLQRYSQQYSSKT